MTALTNLLVLSLPLLRKVGVALAVAALTAIQSDPSALGAIGPLAGAAAALALDWVAKHGSSVAKSVAVKAAFKLAAANTPPPSQ